MPEPFPERSRRECVKQAGTWRASRFSVPGCRVHSTLPVAPPSARSEAAPKLLFLVTEDWFFWSHRLPLARAARDAGFAVIVAARVRDHGERIREEGFILRPLAWKRRKTHVPASEHRWGFGDIVSHSRVGGTPLHPRLPLP
jgi:hypothetical protein